MKNKKPVTSNDVFMEYVKFAIYCILAYGYFHFVIMGW